MNGHMTGCMAVGAVFVSCLFRLERHCNKLVCTLQQQQQQSSSQPSVQEWLEVWSATFL
jgi:hypothetical protein